MKTKKVKLNVSASQLKDAFEPYKAWKMSPKNPKHVHWTHKELNTEDWTYSDPGWHKFGVCERAMEFVYYALYTNGHDDRHDEQRMEFDNKHNLYTKVQNQVSEMIEAIENEKDVVKVLRVGLTLPDGNNNWDWIDVYINE
jgi:hypothetical protein